jgi:hypothetical protein
MSLANPAAALIAADCLMGVGALVALKARGLRDGRNVFVIAFDELSYAGLFDPTHRRRPGRRGDGRLAGEGMMGGHPWGAPRMRGTADQACRARLLPSTGAGP